MTKSYAETCLERAEQATEGPWRDDAGNWEVECKHRNTIAAFDLSYARPDLKTCVCMYSHDHGDNGWNDMKFIADARTDVPELARMVISLEAENAMLKEKINKACEALRYRCYGINFDSKDLADELERVPEEKR